MRILVTGATGVLGRRLVAGFVDRDHEVVGLARTERGEKLIKIGECLRADTGRFLTSSLTFVRDRVRNDKSNGLPGIFTGQCRAVSTSWLVIRTLVMAVS
jgi:nucleoside-diphosphate-sugar epimerase